MPTKLSQFCDHFADTVRPLLGPLETALRALEAGATPGESLSGATQDLQTLHRDLETLLKKVAEQKAYVLIFGPLKSGKSTLMNAVSAAYVSEISSLPAYPCLVFVRHGDKRAAKLRTYAGEERSFDKQTELYREIETAHADLAERIRETEDRGDTFDPEQHFPEAIQRIDVEMPAPDLARTGAVLVDTPGLYTRMRFGYDRMTREFRNSAATAVFVVKSDTLFLEQVFTEFEQLLALFSRIFLVVNMDSTKRDVGPDGALRPSVEQRAPESIIEAFENLAMSAPLKQAARDGRVKIYPVDLMHAASAALSADGKQKLPPSFVTLRDDLREYLASSEYLAAFLGDSLQRAHDLAAELQHFIEDGAVAALRQEAQEVEEQQSEAQAELTHLEELKAKDWDPAFAPYAAELSREVERRSSDLSSKLVRAMAAGVETWFLSSHGLDRLMLQQWQPLVDDFRRDVERIALDIFDQSFTQADGSLKVPERDARYLRALGIDLVESRQQAMRQLGSPRWPDDPPIPLDVDAIPVKRGMLDMLALRSQDRIRDRIFGPGDLPKQKIPARIKSTRMGEPAKQFLQSELMEWRRQLVPATVDHAMAHFAHGLQKKTVARFGPALQEREPELREALGRYERRLAAIRALLEPLQGMADAAGVTLPKIRALTSQHSSLDPDVLLNPAARRDKDEGEKGSRGRNPSSRRRRSRR